MTQLMGQIAGHGRNDALRLGKSLLKRAVLTGADSEVGNFENLGCLRNGLVKISAPVQGLPRGHGIAVGLPRSGPARFRSIAGPQSEMPGTCFR